MGGIVFRMDSIGVLREITKLPAQVQNHLVRQMEIEVDVSGGTWLRSEGQTSASSVPLSSLNPRTVHWIGVRACRAYTLHPAHCLMLNRAEREGSQPYFQYL